MNVKELPVAMQPCAFWGCAGNKPARGLNIAVCIAATVLLVTWLTGCSRPGQADLTHHEGAHVVISLPGGWEHKPGLLTFRKRAGGEVARFLAVDEVALRGRPAEAVVRALEGALPSQSVRVTGQRSDSIGGRAGTVVDFVGSGAQGAPVRGEAGYVPLDSEIVTFFWYVPTSDWEAGQREMATVLSGVRFQ